MTDEEALWLAVGAKPEDALPRLVLADWLEERAGEVKCGRCDECGYFYDPSLPPPHLSKCPTCSGTGFTTDGRADLAASLRATAGYVPSLFIAGGVVGWWKGVYFPNPDACDIPVEVWSKLTPAQRESSWADYPTAADAIRDLCLAYTVMANDNDHRG